MQTENQKNVLPLSPFFLDANQHALKDLVDKTNQVDINSSCQLGCTELSCTEQCRAELPLYPKFSYGNHVKKGKGQDGSSEDADRQIVRIEPTFVDQNKHFCQDTSNIFNTSKTVNAVHKSKVNLKHQHQNTQDNLDLIERSADTHNEESGPDETNRFEPPTLQNGKEHHLFVSYSREDNNRVFRIVTEIENKYKLKCVFDDRDFQPGMPISDNIKDGIERSEKILVMLSKSFVRSNWCKYEVQMAFMRQMQGCANSIIPVRLEECDVPSTLAHLTYIDARCSSTADDVIAEKIFMAYNHKASGYKDLVNGPKATKQPDERGENGFSISLSATPQPLYHWRPAKFRFILTDVMIENLWQNKLFITPENTCRIFRLLNSETAVKYAAWNTAGPVMGLYLFLWCAFFFILSVVIYCLMMMYSSLQNRIVFYEYGFLTVALVMGGTFVISSCALAFIVILWKKRFNKKVRLLKNRMWREISTATIQQGILVIYDPSKDKPTIQIMRYDMQSCKSYLLNYIKSQKDETDNAYTEEFVTLQLTNLLERIYPLLAKDFSNLPKATHVRHKVKQDRQCLCQILEDKLFKK